MVFGRFSTKLGPKTLLERRGSSCNAGCTKNQPRRPILRPLEADRDRLRGQEPAFSSTVGSAQNCVLTNRSGRPQNCVLTNRSGLPQKGVLANESGRLQNAGGALEDLPGPVLGPTRRDYPSRWCSEVSLHVRTCADLFEGQPPNTNQTTNEKMLRTATVCETISSEQCPRARQLTEIPPQSSPRMSRQWPEMV